MDKAHYFEEMRATSSVVIPRIKEAIASLSGADRALSETMAILAVRRTRDNQALLRPYLLRLAYEIHTGHDWSVIADACAAIELFNISTYQSNLAFDRKMGLGSRVAHNNQFICSMLTLASSHELFERAARQNAPDQVDSLLAMLHSTNKAVYLGQYMDSNVLTGGFVLDEMGRPDFMSHYLERCRLLGGRLMAFCLQSGALLAEAPAEAVAVLGEIGQGIGTAGQMVNDLADLIPPRLVQSDLNGYKPSYSDLRNGRVTLAVYDLHENAPEDQQRFVRALLTDRRVTTEEGEELFSLLCRFGSIHRTRRAIARYYHSLKKAIRGVPDCHARRMLSLSLSSLLNNKYFAHVRHDKGVSFP